ncbi:MAG: TetR/AcrR family transcriptional regulator, partial [Acidobacteriota bacterium]
MTAVQDLTEDLADEHVDGRTLRRTRNRTAVIDALLEIIREGNLRPGASEIADRAGVSHRSIFRYFDDLDDLARTAIDHAFEQAGPMADIPDIGSGPLDERIATYVDARLALF